MQKGSNAKYKMMLGVIEVLNKHIELVKPLPNFNAVFNRFLNDFAQFQQLCEDLQLNRPTVSKQKQNLRIEMAEKTLDIASKVRAYAKVTGNENLFVECGIKKSDLYYTRDLQARDNAMVVQDIATAHLAALSVYGLSTAILDQQKAAVDAFTQAIPTAGHIRTDRKERIGRRDEYILVCMNSLSTIDALVEILRNTQPSFYFEYKSLRRVLRSISSLSLKAEVKNAHSGETISGVNVVILSEELNNSKRGKKKAPVKIKKRTLGKGGFNVKSLPEGSYTLSLNKYGYQSHTQLFVINKKETTSLQIKLSKDI